LVCGVLGGTAEGICVPTTAVALTAAAGTVAREPGWLVDAPVSRLAGCAELGWPPERGEPVLPELLGPLDVPPVGDVATVKAVFDNGDDDWGALLAEEPPEPVGPLDAPAAGEPVGVVLWLLFTVVSGVEPSGSGVSAWASADPLTSAAPTPSVTAPVPNQVETSLWRWCARAPPAGRPTFFAVEPLVLRCLLAMADAPLPSDHYSAEATACAEQLGDQRGPARHRPKNNRSLVGKSTR
jgi:hypothetical protein